MTRQRHSHRSPLNIALAAVGALALLGFFSQFSVTEISHGIQKRLHGIQKRLHGVDPADVDSFYDSAMFDDVMHLNYLHAGCLTHKNSVLPWYYGTHASTATEEFVINEDDLDLFAKIRECPDVDIFLPRGIRGHGYCEDAIGYAKFLKSRLLPMWMFAKEFEDLEAKQKATYFDLCPMTPIIFFNHYYDGVPSLPNWPKHKPIYLMPNIEMYELRAEHYWHADAVLCKTAVCGERVTKWYEQEGNPRNTKVFYTRHTSSDASLLAAVKLGKHSIQPKNFTQLRFVHTAGKSAHKGTREAIRCWMSRPDLPPLQLYVSNRSYHERYKQVDGKYPNIHIHPGERDAVEFGQILAEASVVVCPSYIEGYGHYINQARAAGALVITTDVPPMNELITPSRGVLIPVKRVTDPKQLLGGGFHGPHGLEGVDGIRAKFSAMSLCEAVDSVLMDLHPDERQMKAARGKQQYIEDIKFFAAHMEELRSLARTTPAKRDV